MSVSSYVASEGCISHVSTELGPWRVWSPESLHVTAVKELKSR
jgi:hypothetical protein